MSAWEAQDPHGIGVIDAALMIESGGYKRFDKLIVVHCSPEAQVKRVMARNHLDRAEAEARIRAQLPQAEKMKFADYLIDTSGEFAATRKSTEAVYRALRELTAA